MACVGQFGPWVDFLEPMIAEKLEQKFAPGVSRNDADWTKAECS